MGQMMSKWLPDLPFLLEPRQRHMLYVQRICIGCHRPFRKWGVNAIIPIGEQWCSKRCEGTFFRGYSLGLRIYGDIRGRVLQKVM